MHASRHTTGKEESEIPEEINNRNIRTDLTHTHILTFIWYMTSGKGEKTKKNREREKKTV